MLLTGGVLLAGPPLMNVMPRPLLGGMLMAHGLDLVRLWTWDARRWIDAQVSLHKRFFYFEACMHESTIPFSAPPAYIATQFRVQGALQLLSKRHKYNRFVQIPERISVSSYDRDHQRFILDLPMKPGTTRNK